MEGNTFEILGHNVKIVTYKCRTREIADILSNYK